MRCALEPAWLAALLLLALGPATEAGAAASPAAGGLPAAPARRAPAYVEGRAELARIDSLWANGEKPAAHVALEALIDSLRSSSDRSQLGLALILSGAQKVYFGDLRGAGPRIEEGLALARASRDSTALLIGLHRQAIIAERTGLLRECDSLHRETLAIARACGDTRREGWALIGIGWSQQRARQYREAIEKYRQASALLEGIEDWEGHLWALNNIGTAQQSLGDYHEAVATASRVIAESRAHEMPLLEAMALSNLGGLEYALGDPGLALERFERAYALHSSSGALWESIAPAINVALCRSVLGQHAAADTLLQHCLRIAVAEGYADRRGVVLANLARLALRRGQPHEAARRFRAVIAMGDTISARARIEARTGLAQALSLADSVDAAVVLLEGSCASLRGSQERDYLVLLEIDLAKILIDQGRPARALGHLATARELARAQGRQREQLLALVLAGRAHHALGDPFRAHAAYREAVTVWESNRRLPFDPEWREERADLGQHLYTELAHLILAHGAALGIADPTREAFDLLQPYKARTLLERMAGPGTERAIVEAADSLGFVDLAEIQDRVLGGDEILLDAYLGLENSVLFAVTREACRAVELPSASSLRPLLAGYRELLSAPPRSEPPDQAAIDRVGALVVGRLFGGVSDLMVGRRVLLVPDGAFNLLPFAELPGPAAAGGAGSAPWIETASWERVPSATILARLRRLRGSAAGEDEGAARVLALAGEGEPALPGSLREVRSLGRNYRGVETRIVSPERDTLDARILEGPEVIHIASHLAIDDESPWQSALRLGAVTEPPSLTAGRIAGLRLPARLAVLAGCESATGRVVSGEGVLGLGSALLSAGVPAVVASLWPVADGPTAALMLEFYAALSRGRSAAEALREAQLALRSAPETRHPFFWAGFVLIGDGGVRVPIERRRPPAPWLAVPILAAAAAAGWSLRRARRRLD